jgi:hypothetical protein
MTAPTRSAARVLWVDAGLDSVIALLCLVLVATPPAHAWARPAWLDGPVLLVAAAVLAALAVGLLVLARGPDQVVLWALGAGNGASAAAVAIWVAVDHPALGSALRATLLAVAAGLAAVAAAQVHVARCFQPSSQWLSCSCDRVAGPGADR